MITAGIDIAKATLVAAIEGRDGVVEAGNDAAGWRALAGWLRAGGVALVGLEASGGYERGVAGHLARAGFAVRLVDPAGARAYARAMGARAKTDAIDAGWIARYAASLGPAERVPDPRIVALGEELRLVEQLEEDRARWKTRAESYGSARLKARVATGLRHLGREIRARLARLEARLRRHDDLARRLDLVLSIPGIGPRTAIAILIHIPELGGLDRGEAAALAGVAPFARDSGAAAGQRHIAGGRPRLRKALYNAAGMARRWNPDLARHYARLTARGKPHRPAMIACVRKLVIYANTVLARGTPWVATARTE